MTIKIGEEKARIGQDFPLCFDVESYGRHFYRNVSATIYTRGVAVEIRKKNGMLAVFASDPNDSSDVPEYWQDADVIWRQPIEVTP